jgi:hypothetical protein
MTPTESEYVRREIQEMRARILREVFEAIKTTASVTAPSMPS